LHPWHTYAVARLARRDTGPHRNDFANRLVTQRAREVTGQLPARLMHVCVTHSRGF